MNTSNGMVKKEVLDTNPLLLKAEPNGNLAQNGNLECQPCCNIFHHLEFDLDTLHSIFLSSESQIMKSFNHEQFIHLSLRIINPFKHQSTQGVLYVCLDKNLLIIR